MESVIRAAVIYLVLLLIFRVAGKRALSDTTTFDLVMLLIISEAVQQAMLDNDNSMTNAFLLVITLVGLDVAISLLKRFSKRFDQLVEGAPIVLVERGKPLMDRLHKERVDADDVLEAARELRGISLMQDIEYAVLERNGVITIIPRRA
jgi:uncharacterized membrane protein YcaP (DUF421 family)